MAGIWERVKGDAPEEVRRINVTLLRTELLLVAMGTRTRSQSREDFEGDF